MENCKTNKAGLVFDNDAYDKNSLDQAHQDTFECKYDNTDTEYQTTIVKNHDIHPNTLYETLQHDKAHGVKKTMQNVQTKSPKTTEIETIYRIVTIGITVICFMLIVIIGLLIYIIMRTNTDTGVSVSKYQNSSDSVLPSTNVTDSHLIPSTHTAVNQTEIIEMLMGRLDELQQYFASTRDPNVQRNLEIFMNDIMLEIVANTTAHFLILSSEIANQGYGHPYTQYARVYHMASSRGHYKLTFQEGKDLCEADGALIASHQQLHVAWQLGMNLCSCGWLSDGTARFPLWWLDRRCWNADISPGVIDCQNVGSKYNVYCFK